MTLRTGLADQWCAVNETTYGVVPSLATAVFVAAKNDSLELKKTTKQGVGIFAGSLAPRGTRRVVTEYSAGGALPMELPERGMNPWAQRMLGSYGQAAAVMTQDASTGAYSSTHALGPLEGNTFALQAGRPTVDGVVVPFTYSGCKIQEWEVSCALGEIAQLAMTIEARNELALTNASPHTDSLNASVPVLQPYAAPASGSVFRWVGGSILYGGTASTSPLVAAPSAPTVATATTGGTVAAGTYQVVVSYVNAQGETIGSTAAPITTTGSTSTITITSPGALAYAVSWYAYVTQAGGAFATATRQQAAGSPTTLGTNLVLTAPPTSTGALAQSVNTAGALTSVSAPTTAANLTGTLSVKCSRPLDLNRFAPDVAPYRNEPLQIERTQITGSFGVEWLSAGTYYAAYQADTPVAIQLKFTTVGIGSGSDIATFSILVPYTKLNGKTPSASGPEVLKQTVPWEGLDDGVNNVMQATYWSLDSV